MHGGKYGELAVAQAVLAAVIQGELAVAAFDAGTAALERVGAFGGDGVDLAAPIGVEPLQRRVGLTQRCQQLTRAAVQFVALFGVGVLRAATCSR